MKKALLLILLLAASFCLGYFFKGTLTKQNEKSDNSITVKQPDTDNKMKKVTGIGGIFFRCKDPKKVKEWYNTHLGLNTDQYGARFEWQEGSDTTKKGSIQWSAFPETTHYFDPSTKEFMINYRVDNLVSLVEQLKKEGVTITDTLETYDFGKFIHIMDIEGNKIELFEPIFAKKPAQ